MTNHIDEYVSSGTSPTARTRVSNQILTPKQVAKRLKVSERWVSEKSRRRCQSPLPAIRIGCYLGFDWLEVSAWQRQQSGRAA